jgi:hypothetical protein
MAATRRPAWSRVRALGPVLLLAAAFPTAFSSLARAQETPLPIQPFLDLRFEEDWTALAPFESRIATDRWLSWKYAPLTIERTRWLSVGGVVRLRGEGRKDAAFGATPTGIVNEDVYLGRARLHADFQLVEGFRLFAEGLFADVGGRDSQITERAVDADDPDFLNLFIESRSRVAEELYGAMRVGRQQIALGDGRLVGADDWQNAPRAFDGLRVLLESPGFRGTAFFFNEVERDANGFDDTDDANSFFGAFGEWYDDAVRLHTFGFGTHADLASVAGESGEERRATVGLGASIPFFFGTTASAEGALQFGTLGTADIRAFMYDLELEGHADLLGGMRFHTGLSYASGDDAVGDGQVGTFAQLYPDTHLNHGRADVLGGQNLIDLRFGADVTIDERFAVGIALHRFLRADKADGLYDALGAPLLAAYDGGRKVGDEVDLFGTVSLAPHWTVEAGVSFFMPDGDLAAVARDDDQLFAYLSGSFRF